MYKRIKRAISDIKCVTPGELSYRALDAVLYSSGFHHRMYKSGWISDSEVLQAFGNRFASPKELLRYLRGRRNIDFYFPAGEREQYGEILNRCLPGQYEGLIQSAGTILRHKFELLGRQFYFDGKIDWHSGGEGSRWTAVHWCDLRVNNSEEADDVRPLWELNRHQHFYSLGRAYWWTGDEQYAQECVNQLKSWLDDNPPEIGINWQSNLEIAIRSISWLWAFHFFLHSKVLEDDILFKWIKAFIQSARHLDRHMAFSRYCMRNNHIIGDASGLALIAQTFPELVQAKSWKKKAFKVLFNELPRQVYLDGVNWEQSISYHRFVMHLYFLVSRLEYLNGGDVPAEVWSYLEKMFEFIQWACKPDGMAPAVGDSDDGVAFLLGNESIDDFRPALSTGAVAFERGDFKYVAGEIAEETIWLLGLKSLEKWDKLQGIMPENTFRSFSSGGFYISRSDWKPNGGYLLFKNGPHSSFHAHADQLHIELVAQGRDLLIDSGTYIYNTKPKWRNFFRGSFAHNTVIVDGQHQSVPHRSFRWLQSAKPLGVEVAAGRRTHWLRGGHNGYHRLPDPVTHRRGVMNIPGEYTVIFDDFEASSKHSYQFNFHFPPGKAEVMDDRCIFTRLDGMVGLTIYQTDREIECNVVGGRENPKIQGWVSNRYGFRLPSPVFQCSTEKNSSWIKSFVLWPFKQSTAEPVLLESNNSEQGNSIGFTIRHNDMVDLLYYKRNSIGMNKIWKGITTDSEAVFIRFDTSEVPCYLFSAGGTELFIDNIINITGKWSFVEIDIDNKALKIIGGEISGYIRLNSIYFNKVEAGDSFIIREVSAGAWILSKKQV